MKVTDERLERARKRDAGVPRDRHLRQIDLIEWIALGLFKAGLTAENISTLVELPDISKSKEPAAARSASHGSDRDTLAL